jgi:RNA polymerase sigma factor (sigma-70 family)
VATEGRSGPAPGPDDVLEAARANEPWAFERLYREAAPAVAGYLRMHGVADADSLANEVMLGVFQGLRSFEGDRAAFRSWLFTIAHHRLIDDRRRRSVRPEATELLDHHDRSPGGDVEQEALAGLGDERLSELLGALTSDQRAVILLRVVADLSLEEAASVLGKRVGAVKMLQRRGLASLRQMIVSESVTS